MIRVKFGEFVARMEIPESCCECPFVDNDTHKCGIVKEYVVDKSGIAFTYRPDFCPLPAVDIY